MATTKIVLSAVAVFALVQGSLGLYLSPPPAHGCGCAPLPPPVLDPCCYDPLPCLPLVEPCGCGYPYNPLALYDAYPYNLLGLGLYDNFAYPYNVQGLYDFPHGYPYGYPYGGCGCNDCCYEPFTEVTTVSCVPVVETLLKPNPPPCCPRKPCGCC